MKQIAEKAGVSMMTVSRVLRSQSNVSEATRKRIQTIADKLGYTPNRLVRGMQSGRSGIVSFVAPSAHAIAPKILEGAYDVFHEHDIILALDLVKGNVGQNAVEQQSKVINRLLECRVDGIILLPVNEEASPVYFNEIADRNIPLVMVDRKTDQFDSDFVGTDDYAGGFEAARILAKSGCKYPALISVGDVVSTSRGRACGFRDGLNKHDINLLAEIVTPDFTYNIELIDRELSKFKGQLDGVFAVADRLAISAWHTCKNISLEIPKEVRVIGFGALDLRDPRVAISSFDQRPYEIGRNAAKLLLERINDSGPGSRLTSKSIITKAKFCAATSCPDPDLFD